MNTQLIVDNVCNNVFLQAGFLGEENEVANFLLMERIGPGTNHDLPPGAALLADKVYADTIIMLTNFRTGQIRRMAIPDQRRARTFKRRLSRCRVIVAHTMH